MSRRKRQDVKSAMYSDDPEEQMDICRYGSDYSASTEDGFEFFHWLDILREAWNDLADKETVTERWHRRWKTRADFSSDIEQAKNDLMYVYFKAIETKNTQFLRSLTCAIEASAKPIASKERYFLLMLFKGGAVKFPGKYTVNKIHAVMQTVLGRELDVRTVREWCKELSIPTRGGKRGRPKK